MGFLPIPRLAEIWPIQNALQALVSHCLEMWNQPEGAHPSQHTLSSGLRGSHMALQSLGLKGEFKVSKTYFG